MRSSAFLILALLGRATGDGADELRNANDLAKHYAEIFKTGNRNAASHLWARFVLDRASEMAAARVGDVFKGFCPVSGSPIPDDPQTRYKVTLPRVGGGTATGVIHHCCWPCLCDASEFVRVDTKTVKTRDGHHSFEFLVLGDPCKHPKMLEREFEDTFSQTKVSLHDAAPELACNKDGTLKGAIYSDNGFPIIGMLFTGEQDVNAAPLRMPKVNPQDPTFGFAGMCQIRQKQGYNSGMGLIFHHVAEINPVPNSAALPLPPVEEERTQELVQRVSEAPDHCLGSHSKSKLRGVPAYLAALVLVVCAGLVFVSIRVRRQHVQDKAMLTDEMELQQTSMS